MDDCIRCDTHPEGVCAAHCTDCAESDFNCPEHCPDCAFAGEVCEDHLADERDTARDDEARARWEEGE